MHREQRDYLITNLHQEISCCMTSQLHQLHCTVFFLIGMVSFISDWQKLCCSKHRCSHLNMTCSVYVQFSARSQTRTWYSALGNLLTRQTQLVNCNQKTLHVYFCALQLMVLTIPLHFSMLELFKNNNLQILWRILIPVYLWSISLWNIVRLFNITLEVAKERHAVNAGTALMIARSIHINPKNTQGTKCFGLQNKISWFNKFQLCS